MYEYEMATSCRRRVSLSLGLSMIAIWHDIYHTYTVWSWGAGRGIRSPLYPESVDLDPVRNWTYLESLSA